MKNKALHLFSRWYEQVLVWAQHPHALVYLAFVSFAEASFFPIPPDVMLIPMAKSKPENAWWYATLTTLTSVLGGVVGYLLGLFFASLIEPYLVQLGYEGAYHKVQQWFLLWGCWALFLAGFTPIPYKIFTISSGVVEMPLLSFILASLVGRGSRFYLVSGLMRIKSEKIKRLFTLSFSKLVWITLFMAMVILTLNYLY